MCIFFSVDDDDDVNGGDDDVNDDHDEVTIVLVMSRLLTSAIWSRLREVIAFPIDNRIIVGICDNSHMSMAFDQ